MNKPLLASAGCGGVMLRQASSPYRSADTARRPSSPDAASLGLGPTPGFLHKLFRGLPFFLLLAACGGGGGGAAPSATLSGQLSILLAAPQLAAPSADREPNDSAFVARLGAPEGWIDALRDPVDAFRVVAERSGVVTAQLESEGVQGDAILLDLASGKAAAAIDVRAGDVFDVIVRARGGAGRYRVLLREGEGDRAPLELPGGYCDCGDGFVPCEIVAAPEAGFDAEAEGLLRLAEGPSSCLLADPRARDERSFQGLCDVLARCARLEASGLVRYAEPNALRRLAGLPDDPLFPQQWALAQVRALAAWEVATGSGEVVAIVDSGIRAHPDLVLNLVPGHDFEADDTDPLDPTPNFSHGTQVAGVIAAVGDNGAGVSGVLWSAKVMPLRAFDTAGFGTSFDISNAILYAAGLPNESGTLPAEPASVVNLSFASTVFTNAEDDACDEARAAGVFLCAATGNQGSVSVRYPAGYAAVVGVGATTSSGQRASYSNHGTAVDLVAPGGAAGDGVVTTGIVAPDQYDYPRVNGTSFASPHVAAVAALCRGLAPLSPDEVEQILLSTAQDIGTTGFDSETGFGIVDAYRAALAALGQTPPAYVPFEEVEVRLLRAGFMNVFATARTSDLLGFSWSLPDVPPGRYVLEAGTDRNRDGELSGPGELYGQWGGGAVLVVDGTRGGLDFALAEE